MLWTIILIKTFFFFFEGAIQWQRQPQARYYLECAHLESYERIDLRLGYTREEGR